MGLKGLPDLFLAVLLALAVHGAIAAVRIPGSFTSPPKSLETALEIHFLSRPPEPQKEETPPAAEMDKAPVSEKKTSKEERTVSSPKEVAMPKGRGVQVKTVEKRGRSAQAEPERQKSPVEKPTKMVNMSPATDITIPSESMNTAEKTFDAAVARETIRGHSAGILQERETKPPDMTTAVPRDGDNLPPAYPPVARKRGYEGLVLLSVTVRADGTVGEIEIKESSGRDILDRAAIKGVRRWLFVPARREGIPVDARVEVPVRFVLN